MQKPSALPMLGRLLRRLVRRGREIKRRYAPLPTFPSGAHAALEILPQIKSLNKALRSLRILTGDSSIRTFPETVVVNDSLACNLTCPHCQTHGSDEVHRASNDRRRDMSPDAIRRLLDETLPAADALHLTVNGEPLLSMNFELFLEKCAEYQVKLKMVTNATLLSPKRLRPLLPVMGSVGFSVDGASEAVFERLRRGAKFGEVLHNMHVTIRASQLLHPTCVPYFYLSHVLMASNLRGLTGMVRLAKHLGIGTIKGAFAISFFQHTAHEHPENCPGLYNAVHAEASKLAKKLDVSLVIPPPFQGVRPDAHQPLPSGCLLADFDEDSFVAPAFDRFYDRGQANELAVMLAKECRLELTRSHPGLSPSSQVMRIHQDLAHQLHEMQAKHEPFLNSLSQREAAHPGAERLTSCGFIESNLYVGTTEAWLCCMQGTPTFSLESNSSFRDIWNSADLAKFRQGFFHGTTPTICRECPERTSVPASHFLGEVNRGIASLG